MADDVDEPEKDGFFEHLGDAAGYLCYGEFGSKGYKKERGSRSEKPVTGKQAEFRERSERTVKDRSGPRDRRIYSFRR